jgi:hypothetical protein
MARQRVPDPNQEFPLTLPSIIMHTGRYGSGTVHARRSLDPRTHTLPIPDEPGVDPEAAVDAISGHGDSHTVSKPSPDPSHAIGGQFSERGEVLHY